MLADVLWPKDWVTQVLPPTRTEDWFYLIHERLEPPPLDELRDPLYSGGAVLVLTGVPVACEAIDLQTWLLFGVAQDFKPLQRLETELGVSRKKKLLLKQKVDALPSMEVDGTAAQQAETRKTLANAIATHAARYDEELMVLTKRAKRVRRFLVTEPLKLSPLAIEKPASSAALSGDQLPVETRTWIVEFASSRGQELASVAIAKCDWNYVCLVQTRPQPKAFLEDEQVENDIMSASELAKEVNMRTVRVKRLRHGEGDLMVPVPDDDRAEDAVVDPCAEDFHFSSIGGLYSGEFQLGKKHGHGKEFSNAGVFEGDFQDDTRCGSGKLVLGKGTTVSGTFARPSRRYEYGKKAKGKVMPQSLLNGDVFRYGVAHSELMRVTFPDGATYEGEMADGVVSGAGRYVSSTGVVEEGLFREGRLHGKGCRRMFPDGSFVEGEFVDGDVHGRGRQRDKNGDEFEGFFEHGVKQGRGVSVFEGGASKHVGFWRDDAMDGRGDFFYREPGASVPEPKVLGSDDPNPFVSGEWEFWYEGSFLHGETRARHRHVDIQQRHPDHSPFTTSGKSVNKMPFLTTELPERLAKAARRRKANAVRRNERERAYLEQRERENLTLYYSLLDDFFDQWTQRTRFVKELAGMDDDERRLAVEQQKALEDAERHREKMRKEKYDLSPRRRELAKFEQHLERITLTEHVQLQRAMASEVAEVGAKLRKAEAGGQ